MASLQPVGAAASSTGIKSKFVELVRLHDYRVLAGGIVGGVAVGTLLFVLLMPAGSEEAPPEVAKVDVPVASVKVQKVEAQPQSEMPAVVAKEAPVAEPDVTEVQTLKPVAEEVTEEVVEVAEELEIAKPQAEVQDAAIEDAVDVATEGDTTAALPDVEPATVDVDEDTVAGGA